jgi:Cu/Ag efflux protein CusF
VPIIHTPMTSGEAAGKLCAMALRKSKQRAVLLLAALLAGGCADPGSERDPLSDPAAEHVAAGVVESVDPAAGTTVIDHEPVASIGMPAMRMTFRLADPSLAVALRPGERIQFLFVVDDGVVLTRLLPPAADPAQ